MVCHIQAYIWTCSKCSTPASGWNACRKTAIVESLSFPSKGGPNTSFFGWPATRIPGVVGGASAPFRGRRNNSWTKAQTKNTCALGFVERPCGCGWSACALGRGVGLAQSAGGRVNAGAPALSRSTYIHMDVRLCESSDDILIQPLLKNVYHISSMHTDTDVHLRE